MDEVSVSAIIPALDRVENLFELTKQYHAALEQSNISHEFIFVLSPHYTAFEQDIIKLRDTGISCHIVFLSRNFGEATAIQIGAQQSSGQTILTLPPYEQIKPQDIPQILLQEDNPDIVTVVRNPRIDSTVNKFQGKIFNGLLKKLSGSTFEDTGCAVRAINKDVLDNLNLYGDLHRFIPLIAHQKGYTVRQVQIAQSIADSKRRVYPLKTYLSRALDLLTIVFLTKFNKKPLRFFGSIGAIASLSGLIGLAYIAYERIFLSIGASDRPLLVLFSLFLVLGIQLVAVGLVGETIIFTHAKEQTEYRVKRFT